MPKVVSFESGREQLLADTHDHLAILYKEIRRWPISDIQRAREEVARWDDSDPLIVAAMQEFLDCCARPPAALRIAPRRRVEASDARV